MTLTNLSLAKSMTPARVKWSRTGGRTSHSLQLKNRPYALSGVTGRYDNCIAYCDGFLQRLASADADLKNQRPLPSPAAIGFPPTPTPPGGG